MAGQKQKLFTVTNALAYYTPSKIIAMLKRFIALASEDMNAVFPMVILLTVNAEQRIILFEQESSVRLTSFTMPVN
jgi:hypothetical protein